MAERDKMKREFGRTRKRFFQRRSQSSTELILVIAVFLVVISATLYFTSSHFSIVQDTFDIGQARNALRAIAHESDRVYQGGEGSSSRIFVTMPISVNSTAVYNKTIAIQFESGKTTHRSTGFSVRGFIPLRSSWLNIIAKSGYVQYYLDMFEVTPDIISASLMRTNGSSASIVVRNAIDEDIAMNISQTADPDIAIALSSSSFSILEGDQATIYINMTVNANASYGKHYIEMKFAAVSAISSTEMELIVPIIIDVIYDGNESSSIEAIMGILPTAWNASLYPNQATSRNFYAFSGFPTNKTMRLSLSGIGNDYASFEQLPNSSIHELVLEVDAKDNKQFTLYLRPDASAITGNYTIALDYEYEKEVYGMNITIYNSIAISLEVYSDSMPPIVDNTTSSSLIAANGSNVCLYSDIVDDKGIDSAYFTYRYMNDTAQSVEMTLGSCYPNKYSYSLHLGSLGTYSILNVTAYDYASNMGYESTNISIESISVLYSTIFNGTITENPYDGCYLNGSRTWNASTVSYKSDSLYANIPDDNWTSICGYERSDYVEFNFTGIDIYNRNVTSARIAFSHKEDKADGTLPGGIEEFARYMMVQCYNGTAFSDIDTYYPTSSNSSFSDYDNIDISTCVRNRTIANNLSIRVTFDPYNSTVNNSIIKSPIQYIDYIGVEIATKEFYLLDIWPGPSNYQTRADFKSALNSTNNTFYINESSIYMSKQLVNNSGFSGPSFNGWQTSGNMSLTPGGDVLIFSEGFEAANWNLSWTVVPSSGVITRDTSEHSGSYGLSFYQFGSGEGYIYKALNLSGYSNVTLDFYSAAEDLESGDEGWLDVYNGSWHNATIQIGPDNNGRTSTTAAQYDYESISLNSFGLGQDIRIRFRSSAANHASGSGDKDTMLIDDISILSSDKYSYTDYFYIDSTANSTDFGTVSQNFTLGLSSFDTITKVNFTILYSVDPISFNGTIFAFCNLTIGNSNITIWNNTIDSDGINTVDIEYPIQESRNLSDYISNKSATYVMICGAYLTGDAEIAFNDIGIIMNYTARSATDDGWDWEDDTYGHSGTVSSSFVKHYDPSNISGNVTAGAIAISIGGNNSGTSSVMASGAWGIEIYLNDSVYDAIENHDGTALLSFNYKVTDLLPSTKGINGSAWIKSRFGKGSERNYLGAPLDNLIESTLHYTDDTDEIWYLGDYKYKGFGSDNFGNGTLYRSFSEDITQFITSSGPYYLELGGIASWLDSNKSNNEGIMMYFTNIRIIVEYD